MDGSARRQGEERLVRGTAGGVTLEGNLSLPEGASGVVLFAHGSAAAGTAPAIATWHGC
jgi:putative phosphoribosyl transferase